MPREQITVPLPAGATATIAAAAATSNLSVSEFVRHAIAAAIGHPIEMPPRGRPRTLSRKYAPGEVIDLGGGA